MHKYLSFGCTSEMESQSNPIPTASVDFTQQPGERRVQRNLAKRARPVANHAV